MKPRHIWQRCCFYCYWFFALFPVLDSLAFYSSMMPSLKSSSWPMTHVRRAYYNRNIKKQKITFTFTDACNKVGQVLFIFEKAIRNQSMTVKDVRVQFIWTEEGEHYFYILYAKKWTFLAYSWKKKSWNGQFKVSLCVFSNSFHSWKNFAIWLLKKYLFLPNAKSKIFANSC